MPVNPGAPPDYQTSVKAFSDLTAMALRCDVTRSVAMSWADDGGSGPYTMPFLNLADPTTMANNTMIRGSKRAVRAETELSTSSS